MLRYLLSAALGAASALAITPVTRKYGRGRAVVRELLCAALNGGFALLLYRQFGTIPAVLTGAAVGSVLLSVSCTDWDTQEIQDFYHLALAALAVVSVWTLAPVSVPARLIGAFCVSVPMLLLTLAVDGAFGGGDIKLMAAVGLLLGWRLTLLAFAVGLLSGGVWGAGLLLRRKAGRKDHFAFGPFLCVGTAVSLLWGEGLIASYLGLFGL